MDSKVLVMTWTTRGEARFIIRGHEAKTPGRVVEEAVRNLVGVYGLDPTSIRFRVESGE